MVFGDNSSALTSLFTNIDVKTNIPGANFSLDLTAPADPTTQALLAQIQPTITLSGPAGTFPIAPYGAATGSSDSITAALAALGGGALLTLLGAGAGLYWLGKRSARRGR